MLSAVELPTFVLPFPVFGVGGDIFISFLIFLHYGLLQRFLHVYALSQCAPSRYFFHISFCLDILCSTFLSDAFFVYLFFRIALVRYPSLLQFFTSSITTQTVIGVGGNFTLSVEREFDIPSLSLITVLDEI